MPHASIEDDPLQIVHQVTLCLQSVWNSKGFLFQAFHLSETVFVDVLHPILDLHVFNNVRVVFIEGVDKCLDVLQDDIPELDAVVSVVEAWQVHHVSLPQVAQVVKLVPLHLLEGLCQEILDSLRTVTHGKTDIGAAPWCSEDLPAQGVDGDDEPEEVLVEMMMEMLMEMMNLRRC